MPHDEFRDPINVIRELQAKNSTAIRRPRSGDRVAFSVSSKDRYLFTLQTLQALDAEGDFDIIWNDASREDGVPNLVRNWKFQHARLVEYNYPIAGGPDIAICFGLKRLLELGYHYIGLLENDVVLQAGWFGRLLQLFDLGAGEGLVCGAASVRGYQARVLEYRNNYTIDWASGAGMILFSRPAAELILDNYLRPVMTTHSIRRFYADTFSVDIQNPEWREWPEDKPMYLSLDWSYTPFLYLSGYATLGTIPSFAIDLEFDSMRSVYVGPEKNNTGLAYPRCRPVPSVP
jgi:hypothetical protein